MSSITVSNGYVCLDPLYLRGAEVTEWKVMFYEDVVMEVEDNIVNSIITSSEPYLYSVSLFINKLRDGYKKACDNPDELPMIPKPSVYGEVPFPLYIQPYNGSNRCICKEVNDNLMFFNGSSQYKVIDGSIFMEEVLRLMDVLPCTALDGEIVGDVYHINDIQERCTLEERYGMLSRAFQICTSLYGPFRYLSLIRTFKVYNNNDIAKGMLIKTNGEYGRPKSMFMMK